MRQASSRGSFWPLGMNDPEGWPCSLLGHSALEGAPGWGLLREGGARACTVLPLAEATPDLSPAPAAPAHLTPLSARTGFQAETWRPGWQEVLGLGCPPAPQQLVLEWEPVHRILLYFSFL